LGEKSLLGGKKKKNLRNTGKGESEKNRQRGDHAGTGERIDCTGGKRDTRERHQSGENRGDVRHGCEKSGSGQKREKNKVSHKKKKKAFPGEGENVGRLAGGGKKGSGRRKKKAWGGGGFRKKRTKPLGG